MEQKVDLALEIPIALLDDIFPLTDIGFSLAHMILQNEEYRKFYKGKNHIMDNSMYELGQPMEYDDLLNAVLESRPTTIIAPDWMNEAQMTSEAGLMMQSHIMDVQKEVRPDVGIVIQGSGLEERMSFFKWAQMNKFNPICFPFRLREGRQTLIGSLAASNAFRSDEWYHLMGLNATYELGAVKKLPGRWSVDTGKPCKPGLDMKHDDWRGKGKLDILRGYTFDEAEKAMANVEYLRSFL